MDTHWSIKKNKRLQRFGLKTLRLTGVALMLATLWGPLPSNTAQAKDNEWGDLRPPMTSEADTSEVDGFTHLPNFGLDTGGATLEHPITIAGNGDVFVGGGGADVDANANATFGGPTNGVDFDGNTASSGQFTFGDSAPAVYRSTDGGMKWRAAPLPTATVGATIRKIVVSPDYPSDGFVGVVFTAGSAAAGTNGFCWTTNGGTSFSASSCHAGATLGVAGGEWDDVLWSAGALSPDFNFSDGSGSIALGGTWVSGPNSATIAANALVAGTALVDIAETTADAAGDVTIALAYTFSEEPVALARLFGDFSIPSTQAQIRGAGGWGAHTGAESDTLSATVLAATGNVGFRDTYTAGGIFYAAWGSSATATGNAAGGVFRWDGSAWSRKSPTTGNCSGGISDMAVAGTGSSTKLLVSLPATVAVCRSSNEGSSFSKADSDGGDVNCDPQCRVLTTAAITRAAMQRSNSANAYYSISTARGGVMKSSDSGSSWADTGLTNDVYLFTGFSEVDATHAFANACTSLTTTGSGSCFPSSGTAGTGRAVFYTDSFGTGAGWKRVLRYDGSDISFPSIPSSFVTDNTTYIARTTATSENLLKSSDGGKSWKKTSSDPLASSPEASEIISGSAAMSIRNGTTVYIGGNKGHLSYTTDGGATWTVLSVDLGEGIDEWDFIDTARTKYIVTAQSSDGYRKLWMTSDSGATFTQVGDATTAWGSGNPSTSGFSTLIDGLDATGKGTILVSAGSSVSTNDLFRYNTTATSPAWVDGGTDTDWASTSSVKIAGLGDGFTLMLLNSARTSIFRTVYPLTTNSSDWTRQRMNTQLPGGVTSTNWSLGSCKAAGGWCIAVNDRSRAMQMTLLTDFNNGPMNLLPGSNSSVPTNVGTEGIPSVFRWDPINKANCYELQINLNQDFRNPTLDGTAVAMAGGSSSAPGCSTGSGVSSGSSYQITSAIFPLVIGQSYWWRVRVRATDASALLTYNGVSAATGTGIAEPSPWSAIANFSVSTTSTTVTSPQPSLPLNNTQLPGLSTQLSWNNPPGVTQVHVQVTPFNGDGPAINLIFGSAISSYDVPAPVFGTGPYVMLPGAGYTWRVRTSSATTSIGETDPSWGPWSEPRTFLTAKPNSGTIQLVEPINGKATTDTTPTVTWKDANPAMFYYEVQLSADPNFGEQGAKAPVFWNLLHGGQSTPPDSWTVPDSVALAKGTYYWRVRQRVQATAAGSAETGIAFTPAQSFVVQ